MPAARLIAALLTALAAPAGAECRLALVLAMDVSRSVDAADFAIQVEGLATALEDEGVQQAFLVPDGEVALIVYQWSGQAHQEVLVDWQMVRSAADLGRIAATLRLARRPEARLLTALGAAVGYGKGLLDRGPPCRRRVIDVASDGQNNQGPPPPHIYEDGGWEGITVNALAIRAHETGLVDYFRRSLIRGPGAFVEVADRHQDFPPAIRRKLIRELTEAVALLPQRRPGGKS